MNASDDRLQELEQMVDGIETEEDAKQCVIECRDAVLAGEVSPEDSKRLRERIEKWRRQHG